MKLGFREAKCLVQGRSCTTGQSQGPCAWASAFDTCQHSQIAEDHHSCITKPLSREVAYSRTVFNLRNVLMAFWDRLFPHRFSREARGNFTSSLKQKKKKKKNGFSVCRHVQRAFAVNQPSGVRVEVRKGLEEVQGRERKGFCGYFRCLASGAFSTETGALLHLDPKLVFWSKMQISAPLINLDRAASAQACQSLTNDPGHTWERRSASPGWRRPR